MSKTTSRRPSQGAARRKARNRRRTAVGAAAALVVIAVGAGAWASTRDGNDLPAQAALHGDTRLGTVELNVSDLAAQRAFYGDVLGLEVLAETDETVSLGAADQELVRLVRTSDALPAQSDAGLYHSAILYPDETSLAAVLRQVGTQAPEAYQGASDHNVSQAFYFSDPEGNGVELYVDRPRSSWTWDGGRVQMGSAALDPNAFIAEHATEQPGQAPTVGHVHLEVGDLADARRFYVDTLGFAITSEIDGALFMAAGGYHHHLAANTWNSAGAGKRSSSAGLGSFQVLLPTAAEVDDVADRLSAAGYSAQRNGPGLTVDDPWGNTVSVTVAAPSAA